MKKYFLKLPSGSFTKCTISDEQPNFANKKLVAVETDCGTPLIATEGNLFAQLPQLKLFNDSEYSAKIN